MDAEYIKGETMKVKYGQRLTSLFLCLVLIVSLFAGLTPVAYADPVADWPQIATFGVTDNTVYSADGSVKATVDDIEITQFTADQQVAIDDYGNKIVGEIEFSITDPVKVSDGTSAEWPAYLEVQANDWTMTFTDESLVDDWAWNVSIPGYRNDEGIYVDESETFSGMRLWLCDAEETYYFYRVKMAPEGTTPSENHAPKIKNNAPSGD